jgi:hypothetical protein
MANAFTASRMSVPVPTTFTASTDSHPASHASSVPSIGVGVITAAFSTTASTGAIAHAARHRSRAPDALPRLPRTTARRSTGIAETASSASALRWP